MRLSLGLMLGGLMLLAGCAGSDHEDLREWMREATKDIKGNVRPLPEVKPYESVQFDVGKEGDPFRPGKIAPDSEKSGSGVQPDVSRPREPLESYPLESLAFVGVLEQGTKRYALIKADEALHRVAVGNYMGRDFGMVVKVAETEVTLKELIQDAGGDWVERMSVLQLLEQKEPKK